ncbi:MAG: acetamidase/formamidase family protein [Butyrivibrio sp.]
MYIKKENYISEFKPDMEPAARVKVPCTVTFETRDCFSGHYTKETDVVEKLDYSTINPSTGPVFFEGAMPGDVLEIHIDKIECAKSGCTMCIPNEGLLGHLVEKSITKIYDLSEGKVKISEGVELPIEPMIGVIGIAPKEGEFKTILPGDHGGNMDTTLIKEGSTLFLPVGAEGGLLAMGDLHAAMGDGESFYTGLEVAGEVTVSVKVRKDMKIDIPFVLCGDKFASVATENTVDKALEKAMEKLVLFIKDHSKLDFYEAGFLCGLYANLEISQVVDPVKTARMSIKTKFLKECGIEL